MSTLSTTLAGAAIIAASTAPTAGNINSYDATSGALTPTLPALSGLNAGAWMVIEKAITDTTYNTVTFTRAGSDTFQDTSTTVVLAQPGEQVLLQRIDVSSVAYWKIISRSTKRTGLKSRTTQLALNTSTTLTDIITETLPGAQLAAGSTFRIRVLGTVKVKATSGTLTFTPYIQNTALNTIQLASQTSAEGPVGFTLEIYVTVRTTGATGTAIAHGNGVIRFSTNAQINQLLTSTNTSTTTIDTTSAATPTLALKAQWATNDANNALAVEIATIERVL